MPAQVFGEDLRMMSLKGARMTPMPQPLTSTVLVGRQQELAHVHEALTALASQGAGGMLLISGEAGVGKTRLLQALLDRADDLDLPVYVGRCLEFGDAVFPAAPVVDIVGDMAIRLDPKVRESVMGPAEQDLAALIPSLGTSSPSGTLKAEQLFALVYEVFGRLAERGPLVLAVEDLHWADRTTRDLLLYLTMRLRSLPILLVATYRSDDLHRRHPLLPMLAELQRAVRPDRVELTPFDTKTTADLVHVIGGDDLDQAAIEELHRKSGGNAFYLEELLAAGGAEGAIPATLREIVLSRSRSLDDHALAVLRVAAAVGSHIDESLVALTSGLDKEMVNHALRQLVESKFLVAGAANFSFRHDLTREVFADELLPGERTELHGRIAEALEGSAPGRHGEIAHHWWHSGNQPAALRSAIAAADAADSSGAVAEAFLHLERALELWELVPTERRETSLSHPELLLRAAEAAHLVQDFERCNALARQASSELTGTDSVTQALVLKQRGQWLWDSGEPGLEDLADQALGLVRSEPASAGVAEVYAWVAGVQMLCSRFQRSIELGETALQMAQALGETRTEANAMNTLAVNRLGLGDTSALDHMRRALEVALQSGDIGEVNRAYINLTELLVVSGRYAEAVIRSYEGEQHALDHGYRGVCRALLACNASHALAALGRWDEVEAMAEQVLDHRRLNLDVAAPTNLTSLATVMVKRGQTDQARPILEHDLAAESTGYYGCGSAELYCSLLELALVESTTTPDRALIETGIEMTSIAAGRGPVDLMAHALRSEANAAVAARHRGDDEAMVAAREASDRWLAYAEECLVKFADPEFDPDLLPMMTLCRAEHARAQGQNDHQHWADVVAAWEPLERPWDMAYAQWRHAEALLVGGASNAHTEAAGLLRRASSTATELGAKPLLADIANLATRARIDLGADEAADGDLAGEREAAPVPYDLTPRELEVLGLVAQGYSNGRIGSELFISTKTASVHVSNILRKLGAANRIEAAAIATGAEIV